MGIRWDDQGLVVDDIDSTRQQMVDEANIAFAPYLNGTTLKTDNSSVLGRTFSITAVPAVQNASILPSWTASLDPNQAEGLALDWLVNTANMKRLDASQAVGIAMLFGDIGVTVPQNTRIASARTGDVYSTNTSTLLDNNDANGVEVEINTISSPITITYNINGYLSESPPITVQLGVNDTTISAVADRIVDAVNSQSSYLVATKNNDNSVKIIIEDQNRNGDFTTSSNLTIARAYKQVRITSETYSSDEAAENTITVRKNTVVGFRGVTNPFKVFASQPVEDDERLRYRFKLNKGSGSTGSYTAMSFAIRSVEGVTFANIQANTTPNTSGNGITNNGLAITVNGGNEDDIALAIFNSIGAGIATVGSITKNVTDPNGATQKISFSRPVLVPVEISMALTVYPDFPVGGQIAIKQAIVEYFNNLTVGEDVYYSRLYEPINSVRGFSVRNLKINKLGQTLLTEDIIIGYNEIATISYENIKIGGN